MTNYVLYTAIKWIVGYVLEHTDLNFLLERVGQAEHEFTDGDTKKVAVAEVVRSREPDSKSGSVINMAVELAVYAYKYLK